VAKPSKKISTDGMRYELINGKAKFLKDSKVKDRVYHGTASNFNVFKPTRSGEFGPAIYTTDSPREAGEYGEGQQKQGVNIMPLHINLKNPYTKGVDEFWKEFGKDDDDAAAVERAKAKGYDGVIAQRADDYYDNAEKKFVSTGKKLTHYIAFHPNQVKSAIGNRGTYDPNDPDITKATGGAVPIGPPADIAEKLAALKEEMRKQGTDFNRRMQGVVNAEKTAGTGTRLPTDKAKGGLAHMADGGQPKDPDYHSKVAQDLKWHASRGKRISHGHATFHNLVSNDFDKLGNFYGEHVDPILAKHKYPTPPDGPNGSAKPEYYKAIEDIEKHWQGLTKEGTDKWWGKEHKAKGGKVEVRPTVFDDAKRELYKKGGEVEPFDYENPEHTYKVAHHLSKHPDFKKAIAPDLDAKQILHEIMATGDHRFIEDPRSQEAIHKAGHREYYIQEKTGKVKYPVQHVVKKAFGGSINEMRAEMMGRKPSSLSDLTGIGANEAPNMNVKAYVPPTNQEKLPVGGVSTSRGSLPIGGVDMNSQQQGQQFAPQIAPPPAPPQGQPSPLSAGASSPSQQSNILQMTPQGQALSAMKAPEPTQPMPQMADGGGVGHYASEGAVKKIKYTPPGMGREMNEPQLPRVAPMSKADIEKIALRMAPQIAGQYTPESQKTQKQFAREQNLKHEMQPTASPLNQAQDIDLGKHQDKVMVGLPGDYTITNQELKKVAGKKLKYPVVQEGGSRYGMTHPNSIWASQEDAAQSMLNLAKAASRQYGDADVLANHIKMGPDSAYYAKHYVRALLSAIESAKLTRAQKDELTKLLREKQFGYGEFPNAPHVKDIKDLYAEIDFNPNFRRHVGALMNRKYATDPYKITSGEDMLHATSEPELRNLETGVTGHSIGELHFDKPLTRSSHSTYSHDIPGKFLGKLAVPTPYELSFPDAVHALRNSKDPEHKKALFGSLKMFGARQKIDQQLVDEIGQYRDMIKKLTGKKKGGKVSQDGMVYELTVKSKKKVKQ
jgi:hypothetical protein